MDHRAASEELGLPADADLASVKRRFRALAHDHHPDRGGDAARFAAINDAYRLLSASEPESTPRRPTVARGRPSRDARPVDDVATGAVTGLTVAGLLAVDGDGREAVHLARVRNLTPLQLAQLIRRTSGLTARGIVLVSRAPGSRMNRLAHVLAADATSTLRCAAGPGGAGLTIELQARARPARRHLARLGSTMVDVPAVWQRRRVDAVTTLVTSVTAGTSTAETAVLATERILALLTALHWPLDEWRIDGERMPREPGST